MAFTVIRPMDFLHCCSPTDITPVEVCNNSNYVPPQEREGLLNLYKTSVTPMENYWHLLKNEYLFSLGEGQTLVHKEQRIPRIGNLVLVKETSLGREGWKLSRIEEIEARHDYIKAVTTVLPNHKRIGRLL